MDTWFTIEKIDSQTFSLSEYKHWEETHSYLLCGENKALLIDTGLGVSNIKEVVDELTDLPVTVFTTHIHWDHIGGHRYFDCIGVHKEEKEWLSKKFPLSLEVVKKQLTEKAHNFPCDFNIDDYKIFQVKPQIVFQNGYIFDLGGRTIEVIHTPGHSPGHCCFYEHERKYLYCGDLIYKGCLYAFYPTTDPKLFYKSIKKIQKYDIKRVLPGHHDLNITSSLINEIEAGFRLLESRGDLKQGKGIFNFGNYQIWI